MDPELRSRLAATALLLVVGAIGIFMGTGSTSASEARVEALMAQEQDVEQARTQALARDFRYEKLEAVFDSELLRDQEGFGLRPVDIELLRQPNRFEQVVREETPVELGASVGGEQVALTLATQKITTQRTGVAISRSHTVAVVKNLSDHPVAYLLHIRASKPCKIRGATRHNAMALMPGETATVPVCGGAASAIVEDFRALSLTPVGYFYWSKVPPGAAGHDAVTARSHEPPRKAEICGAVGAVRLAARIDQGDLAWEDVADFFSRHNCERYTFPDGYRRATSAIDRLPHEPK